MKKYWVHLSGVLFICFAVSLGYYHLSSPQRKIASIDDEKGFKCSSGNEVNLLIKPDDNSNSLTKMSIEGKIGPIEYVEAGLTLQESEEGELFYEAVMANIRLTINKQSRQGIVSIEGWSHTDKMGHAVKYKNMAFTVICSWSKN